MDHTLLLTIGVVFLALLFGFTGSFHDSATQVCTVISSRTLSPEAALSIAAVADFAGAYFLGTSVAETIGRGIVDPEQMRSSAQGILILISALTSAVTWNMITWYWGIPSSSTHALIGGLLGAFLAGLGAGPIQWVNVRNILIVMFAAPLVVFLATYIFTKAVFALGERLDRGAGAAFKGLQVLTLIGQSLAHGGNEAQKIMGIMAFAIAVITAQPSSNFGVPWWATFLSASVLGMGVLLSGWKIIRTLGTKLYRIQPIQSFTSQTASAGIILGSSIMGFPVSTTQVITSSVMGAGAGFRPRDVRWAVAADLITAWFITIPAAGLLAAGIFGAARIFL